jgi:hypothetical protein
VDERRTGARFEVWFPVQIEPAEEKGGAPRITVSRDVSTRGILLSSASELKPGAKVVVSFRVLPDEKNERRVEGTVVRVDQNQEDPDGLWPVRLAVEFAERVPELERQLKYAESIRKKSYD